MKFPDFGKSETLERRYLGKIQKKALQFMKALLKLDPSERLCSKGALNHCYFDGLREQEQHNFGSSKEQQIQAYKTTMFTPTIKNLIQKDQAKNQQIPQVIQKSQLMQNNVYQYSLNKDDDKFSHLIRKKNNPN